MTISLGVTRSVGMIIMYICGAFLPWYQTAYVGMIFPLIAAILLLNSPESPVFLVSKVNFHKKLLSINFYIIRIR